MCSGLSYAQVDIKLVPVSRGIVLDIEEALLHCGLRADLICKLNMLAIQSGYDF